VLERDRDLTLHITLLIAFGADAKQVLPQFDGIRMVGTPRQGLIDSLRGGGEVAFRQGGPGAGQPILNVLFVKSVLRARRQFPRLGFLRIEPNRTLARREYGLKITR